MPSPSSDAGDSTNHDDRRMKERRPSFGFRTKPTDNGRHNVDTNTIPVKAEINAISIWTAELTEQVLI